MLGRNMVIPRSIAAALGGFDERFVAGGPSRAADDTGSVFRACRAGYAVAYRPDMAVRHFHRRRRVLASLSVRP